jgi:hypothetical protein
MHLRGRGLLGAALGLWICSSSGQEEPLSRPNPVPEVTYKLDRRPEVPWSINIVRVPRRSGTFEIHAWHGAGRAVGLGTVSQQAAGIRPDLGTAVAAINGDFYQRQGPYSGDPRGLQIMEGELISAPVGSASFWMDASGEPHIANTESGLRVTWPDGHSTPIELNQARKANAIVLYTPALGTSTQTKGGREMVLERDSDLLPLKPGKAYRTRVAEVRNTGNSPLSPQKVVLSIGPGLAASCPQVPVGAELVITTDTTPSLRGVKTAISGGPVLVRGGKAQRVRVPDSDSYEFGSATERHPRSAVGWNDDYFFFVEVDGRQKRVSVGMTLQELASYLAKLGCTDAMNLDGGGSATLWYAGQVRNRPCDGHERVVGNALVAIQRRFKTGLGTPTAAVSPGTALSP